MQKYKVAFFDVKDFEKDYILNNKPEECEFQLFADCFHTFMETKSDEVKDIDILSIFTSSRVMKEDLQKFSNLKLIATRSTGYSHVNIDLCAQEEIPVVNVPKYGNCTVAEFAFGLLLDVARKINVAHKDLQKGIINAHQYIGIDLFGKTIGIIGTGAIGAHTIQIANGFGMNIVAFDPYPKSELVEKYNVQYLELDELLAKSDIISLHAPSTKENKHMINDESFAKMKDGVIIINTARGEIMDTTALYKALLSKKVAAAGLDVVECEEILMQEDKYITKVDCIKPECLTKTLINHKLLDFPNVVITPHVAYDSIEAVNRILETTIDNIKDFIQGKTINRVN